MFKSTPTELTQSSITVLKDSSSFLEFISC